MRYRLSKLIPMHFQSTYGTVHQDKTITEHASWWQWRDRIMGYRRQTI